MDAQSTTIDGLSPWLTVWVSPRTTIRKIVDSDPHRFIVGIAWVAGALAALNLEGINSAEVPVNLTGPVGLSSLGSIGEALFAFVLGVAGVAMVYLLAMLYRWSGALLGGTGQTPEVRSALAWAQVPAIYISLLGVIVAVAGIDEPTMRTQLRPAFSWWALVQAALAVWAFVITLKMIGEVHRFSAWRAFAATILGGLAVFGAAFGMLLLFVVALVIGRALF
jgi:Yip1-like protein